MSYGPALLSTTQRKARRRRRCFECGWWIEPHSVYTDERLACDGRAYRLTMHCDCAEAGRSYPWNFAHDDDRPPLHEIVSGSGEPLTGFDFPDPVLTRIALAFKEAAERQAAYLNDRLAEAHASLAKLRAGAA